MNLPTTLARIARFCSAAFSAQTRCGSGEQMQNSAAYARERGRTKKTSDHMAPQRVLPTSRTKASALAVRITASPSCDSRRMTCAQQVDVDYACYRSYACYISIGSPSTSCTDEQGMAGGERGRSVLDHPHMPFVYGTTNHSIHWRNENCQVSNVRLYYH